MDKANRTSQSGIALLELALILVPLVLVVVAGIECVSYMRQKQVAQMLSREMAVAVYKRCSGLEQPVAGAVSATRVENCVQEVEQTMRNITGQASGATFAVALFRCDPNMGPPITPCAAATRIHPRPGTSTPFDSAVNGGRLRQLMISQRVAVAVRVGFPFRTAIGGALARRTLRFMNLATVTDVTIL